jgi:hypothetical protein
MNIEAEEILGEKRLYFSLARYVNPFLLPPNVLSSSLPPFESGPTDTSTLAQQSPPHQFGLPYPNVYLKPLNFNEPQTQTLTSISNNNLNSLGMKLVLR